MRPLLPSLSGSQPRGDRATQTRALKEIVRTQFGLGEDDNVFVAEITCGEADCPDVETVIAVFVAGERCEFHIHKPVDSIAASDLAGIEIRPD